MKYEVWNYNTLKVIAVCNDIKSAMKRAYKEQIAHKRSRFAIVNENGASPGFTEMGQTPKYKDTVIFQKHNMRTQESMGAYKLYPSGMIKML